jgi:hypothetical protein
MSIKNVTPVDLALVELLTAGRTAAPRDVLELLRSRGHLVVTGGKYRLTSKGRRRAEGLRGCEHDLRLRQQAAAEGGAAVKTVGGQSFHISGGSPVRIRT